MTCCVFTTQLNLPRFRRKTQLMAGSAHMCRCGRVIRIDLESSTIYGCGDILCDESEIARAAASTLTLQQRTLLSPTRMRLGKSFAVIESF